jgi:arabinogalactan oligomer/maltooligosaccharide transport system substrate-binding protein
MLLYNKKLVETPPANTDELIALGQKLTKDGQYGLVYDQTEPFWIIPWLGGFKGKVFADDGVTPTLDTPEMVAALKFMYDLKYTTPMMPAESDYGGADTLFKEGKAAMIINGDWSLGGYIGSGIDFGVARIPMVTATKEWPRPYTSGIYFVLPKGLQGAKLNAVKGFIDFVTSPNNQALMIAKLRRLPALKAALNDSLITDDPVLKGSADQMLVGEPMPTVNQMRCNWDSMKPEMQAMLANRRTPEDAAKAMQAAALNCIASSK